LVPKRHGATNDVTEGGPLVEKEDKKNYTKEKDNKNDSKKNCNKKDNKNDRKQKSQKSQNKNPQIKNKYPDTSQIN
jgi:Na+/glutamate symporter